MNGVFLMSFGSQLRKARLDAGLTQKQLAVAVDAKHNSISNWENDQNRPDTDTINLLCTTLNISPNYLLGEYEQNGPIEPNMGNLFTVLQKLCDEKGITGYRMCKDVGIQPSIMTDLKMGRRVGVNAETASKIANYFNVSVDYLLGKEVDMVVERIVECIGPKHGAVKELADAIGVHPNVITAWKNGSLKSYRKYLPEIADFFGVTVEWLTGKTDIKREPASTQDNELPVFGNVYQIIESYCLAEGITVAQMCRETGITQSTITEVKHGRTKTLSMRNLSKIADFFGVTVDSFKDKVDVTAVIKRIETRLIELDMSKAEFYLKSGISSASFSQWKTGLYVPSEKKLKAVAECLNMDLSHLLGADSDEPKMDEPDRETLEVRLLKASRLLSLNKLQSLVDFLEEK